MWLTTFVARCCFCQAFSTCSFAFYMNRFSRCVYIFFIYVYILRTTIIESVYFFTIYVIVGSLRTAYIKVYKNLYENYMCKPFLCPGMAKGGEVKSTKICTSYFAIKVISVIKWCNEIDFLSRPTLESLSINLLLFLKLHPAARSHILAHIYGMCLSVSGCCFFARKFLLIRRNFCAS